MISHMYRRHWVVHRQLLPEAVLMRQITLTGGQVVLCAWSGSRWRRLSDLPVCLCSLNLWPFKAVEDETLMELMDSLDSKYRPPKRIYVCNRAK